jgi:hypothetical protein
MMRGRDLDGGRKGREGRKRRTVVPWEGLRGTSFESTVVVEAGRGSPSGKVRERGGAMLREMVPSWLTVRPRTLYGSINSDFSCEGEVMERKDKREWCEGYLKPLTFEGGFGKSMNSFGRLIE